MGPLTDSFIEPLAGWLTAGMQLHKRSAPGWAVSH